MLPAGCVFWCGKRGRLPWAETVHRKGPDRARSAPLERRKVQQRPEGRPFFPHAQPFRRRLGLCQPLSVVDAPGLGALGLTFLLVGKRWETGQVVQVGDDAGQHPEHTGSVERDVLRLGIGLGPQVHHDPLTAIQAFQPLAALAEIKARDWTPSRSSLQTLGY